MRIVLTSGLLAVCVSGSFAAPVPKLDARKQQEEAVKRIEELRGVVFYDCQVSRTKNGDIDEYDPNAQLPDATAFSPVVTVYLNKDEQATDDGVRQLAKLPALEEVYLGGITPSLK